MSIKRQKSLENTVVGVLFALFVLMLAIILIGVAIQKITGAFDAYSNQYDLYVLDLETSESHRIDMASDVLDSAAWSPDGTQFAFVKRHRGKYTLMIQQVTEHGEPASKPINSVLLADIESIERIMWSPDGKLISYLVRGWRNSKYFQRLYLYDLETGDNRQLTELDIRSASWSPNGQSFAIVTYNPSEFGGGAILDVSSGEITPSGSVGYSTPAWSPDGQWIVFGPGRVMSLDDSENLYDIVTAAPYSSIQWSPNSTGFLYEENTDDGRDLYLWNLGSKDRRLIYGEERFNTCAVWSVDGKSILFVASYYTNSSADLMSISLAGGEAETLWHNEDQRGCPAWSPNRKLVAYFKFMRGSDPAD